MTDRPVMDHAAAHERIADLALEPAWVDAALDDRLGEPQLVEHVATCERCQADLKAWRGLQRSLDRSLRPSAPGDRANIEPIEAGDAIRSRILAAARTGGTEATERTSVTEPASPATAGRRFVIPPWSSAGQSRAGQPRIGSTVLGLAAALVVAIAGTLLLAGPGMDLARQVSQARTLTNAMAAIDRVLADPAHQVVELKTNDGKSGGSVAWSSQDLVVLTSAIQAPPSGSVYRCWLVGRDHEAPVGQMDFAGNTGYWVGSLEDWASTALRPGWSFYITLESGSAGLHRAGPVVLEADFGAS